MTKKLPLVAIVDDDESVRKAFERLLRSAGLQAATFSCGAQFLASLPEREPDCVVLDIHMPGLTGFNVLARLAETASTLPVVLITGQDSHEAHERAVAAGAMAYLLKPVDDRTLLQVIYLALERRRCQGETQIEPV